jgi:hypothetical protein
LCREVPLSFPHVSHRRILRSSYCPKVLRSSAQLRYLIKSLIALYILTKASGKSSQSISLF